MNTQYLIFTLSFFYIHDAIGFWSKKEPENTCRFQDTAGTYPNDLCARTDAFIIQQKLFIAQERLKNAEAKLKDQQEHPDELNDQEDTQLVMPDLVRAAEEEKAKFNELKKDHEKFFDDNTDELIIGINNRLLLYGPIGTGKTMIAKKISELSKSKTIHLSGSTIITTYQSQGAHIIKETFQQAISDVSSGAFEAITIYIDEIDKFAAAGKDSNKEEYASATAELWQALDLIKNEPRINFIGSTNCCGKLHKTLLDRFDDEGQIRIDNPDATMRRELFKFFFSKADTSKLSDIKDARGYFSWFKSNEDIVLDYLVKKTEGKAARFIENYVNNARNYAFYYNNKVLTYDILKKCFDRMEEKEKKTKADNAKEAEEQQRSPEIDKLRKALTILQLIKISLNIGEKIGKPVFDHYFPPKSDQTAERAEK